MGLHIPRTITYRSKGYRLRHTRTGLRLANRDAKELRDRGYYVVQKKHVMGRAVRFLVYARAGPHATETTNIGKRWVILPGYGWLRTTIYRTAGGNLYHKSGRAEKTFVKPGQLRRSRP